MHFFFKQISFIQTKSLTFKNVSISKATDTIFYLHFTFPPWFHVNMYICSLFAVFLVQNIQLNPKKYTYKMKNYMFTNITSHYWQDEVCVSKQFNVNEKYFWEIRQSRQVFWQISISLNGFPFAWASTKKSKE